MFRFILITCGLLWQAAVFAQPRTDSFLLHLLKGNPQPALQQVLNAPGTYRCQVIYTQINRDARNQPHFTNYYFNYDPALYFNPASTVKLPLAFLSLEKLNDLKKRGVNKYTTIQFDSSYEGQTAFVRDTTAKDGKPTIAHFIKRAFLISENDPYNRMYQFVGQEGINRELHKKGYTDVRITRQFHPNTAEQNRHTNAVRFLDATGRTIYAQPAAHNRDSFLFPEPVLVGKAYYDRNDSLVPAPMDFTTHNNLSLGDLQGMLQSVLFPETLLKQQRFRLRADDYTFLYRWLSQYPSETDDPKYDTSHFYDSYVKFFFRDSTHRMPASVRVFNKVGWAYGFLTDVSYVIDKAQGVEYMLVATLYVNSDGVLNDNKYDYNSIGHPFLYQLGQTIYNYEISRPRRYRPDLSPFIIQYDQRDPADKRLPMAEVDN